MDTIRGGKHSTHSYLSAYKNSIVPGTAKSAVNKRPIDTPEEARYLMQTRTKRGVASRLQDHCIGLFRL